MFVIGLILHPSKELTRDQLFEPIVQFPETVVPGAPVVVKNDEDLKNILIGSDKMSAISQNKYLIGTAPLYGTSHLMIVGTWKTRTLNWLAAQFFHPQLDYFKKVIQIDHPKLVEAPQLRIPSSTWEKMDESYELQKENEKKIMRELLEQWHGELRDICWMMPIESKVVSSFASPRTLPNGKSYYHSGVDMRALVPTEIRSPASGRVVFAKKMIVPGNILVIDHGGGFFTRFMHLSEFLVSEGDKVKPQQKIALTGATGRVEAPHLHWEVIWKGNHVDPFLFLQALEPICDQE